METWSLEQCSSTRSNKCTTSVTTFDGTGTGSGMPMGPIHYPISWFSTAFIFSAPSTSGSQKAGASQSVPAVGWQNSSPSGELGKDHRQWVLDTVAGYKLELEKIPCQTHNPVTVAQRNQEEPIHQEVQTLLDKGAVIGVPPAQADEGFYSTLLLVPKRGPEQAGVQPSSSEQICESRAFQNGGNAQCERPPARGRLDDKTRFEGCILCNSGTQAPP